MPDLQCQKSPSPPANQHHRHEATPAGRLHALLQGKAMASVAAAAHMALHTDAPVLILGPSGSGKTRLAHALAEACATGPVVRATLGMTDDLNTLVSELYGHTRSAFSGASSARRGLVEMADRGVLIFDEILNLSKPAQQLLLDFTQFGTFRPLGYEGQTPRTAQVRIIAATNGDMEQAVREGRFRQDLYYRLAGITLRVPPLDERRDEIPGMLRSSLLAADPGGQRCLEPELVAVLQSEALHWPGNVRQLEMVVRKALARARADEPDGSVVSCRHLVESGMSQLLARAPACEPTPAAIREVDLREAWTRLSDEREALARREAALLHEAMRRHGGVVTHAARALGLARTTLASRLGAAPGNAPSRGVWPTLADA